MFGGLVTPNLMTKKEHNINCINKILGLNIPQITEAVRNAIRKHNIFDGDRPNNTDLLYIAFECLTSYLDKLNLQHIRANEQNLLEEINRIGQILEIVNVGRYLQYVDYRFRISSVLSRKVSDNMVSLTLSGVYFEAEKAFKNQDKQKYAKNDSNDLSLSNRFTIESVDPESVLDQITSITQITNETPENGLASDQLRFWFDNVIPLIFDKNKEIQKSALAAVEAAIPFFRFSSYQEHPNWLIVEKNITNVYKDNVIALRDYGDPLWYRMWNVLIRLLNKKLLKGATVINQFLAICESGFKSPNYTTRAETFLCWKVLLEVYSQDAKHLSAKRIKLLLIPFKTIAKSPQIAVNKFSVWWSLICRMENQIDQYYNTVLVPFLGFCFGLTDNPILSKTVDPGTRQEIYPELRIPSITALINLLGPVQDATNELNKSFRIDRIDEPSRLPALLENAGQFLINSCGEATFLLRNIELEDAVVMCNNLWTNMMNRMKGNSDPTLTELLVQNLTILANESQNDEPAIRLVTHAATIVLSSKNLIPFNTSDDVTLGIVKRIVHLLTNKTIQLNENALQKIVNNVFTFSTETNRLNLQLQHVLTLLQSQKLLTSLNVGGRVWYKAAKHILDTQIGNFGANKEIIYGYVEWAVKNTKTDQLPMFITTWKNLARLSLNNDEHEVFWKRLTEILRSLTDGTDVTIYKFIASVFKLIEPGDPFPSEFKFLIESVVSFTPTNRVTELQPIIDEINELSHRNTGAQATATYQSLNELVSILEAKFDSLRNQFQKFRSNFEKFTKSQKSTKPKDDDFVFIPSKWQFRPDNLTEHQKERLKEKRVDIPALYNDLSQSQDSHSISLKPWTPNKQIQVDSAETPNRIVVNGTSVQEKSHCDTTNKDSSSGNALAVVESEKSHFDITINDLPIDPHPQPPQPEEVDTMANTSPDNDSQLQQTGNDSQSTPGKVDVEERKRRRIQNELNKLQMSIANADQYSNQSRTRRMSINVTKPEQRLRKRSQTMVDQTVSVKRARRTTVNVVADTENDSNEVIEASQTLPTTPTARRTRQKRGSLGKKQALADEKTLTDTEPILSKKESNEVDNDERMNDNPTDSHSAEEKTVQETADDLKSREIASEDLKEPSDAEQGTDVKNKKSEATTEPEETVQVAPEAIQSTEFVNSTEVASEESCVEQVSNAVNINAEPDHVSVNESEPKVEISMEKPVEATSPEQIIDQSPSGDVLPVLTSPVKISDDRAVESKIDVIITSPIANKNCSKTTELLNSTVDLSPIPHAKVGRNVDPESKHNEQDQHSSTGGYCNDTIGTDRIRRTELDDLIKTPMDSPMLQLQNSYNVPMNSTPQSHKDTKRKFQIQGRGAQFLQLVKIRKVEEASSPKPKPKPASVPANEPVMIPAEPLTTDANNLLSYEQILATNKDLFRFSKVLPSPQASPSGSIMKRSIVNEMTDTDENESSSGQKRKRVSFHDPPVSATKEFLRFAEEVNTQRIRVHKNGNSPLNMRNILIRKGRVDSLNEIKTVVLPSNDTIAHKSETSIKLKFNGADDDDEVSAVPLFTFSSKDDVLQHVLDEYPMEEVIGKYFESGLTLNDSSAKIFTNQLSNLMKSDETKGKLILEDFSEKFPKGFLDVALQENLTSTVIQRLPQANILNHITEQAKSDDNMKHQLIEKFSSIIGDDEEMNDDLYQLLLKIIAKKMNDHQLLDLLDNLFKKRLTNSGS